MDNGEERRGFARLRREAEANGGWFSTEMARACAVSSRSLARRLATGEVERLRRAGYRFRAAAMDHESTLRAALDACGPLAAVSGATALRLRGVDRVPEPAVPELIVPFGRLRIPQGVKVVRSRAFDPDEHVVEVRGIRCLTGPFNILQIADGRWSDHFLASVLDDLVCKRAASRAKVHELTSSLARGRHHQVRWVARLTAPGAAADFHSFLERVAGTAFDAYGLPPAEWNVEVHDDGGLIGVVDALWRWRPHVSEIEGLRFHTTPRQRRADSERFNRLVLADYRPLRHSYANLMTRPQWCAAQVARALAGAPRPR